MTESRAPSRGPRSGDGQCEPRGPPQAASTHGTTFAGQMWRGAAPSADRHSTTGVVHGQDHRTSRRPTATPFRVPSPSSDAGGGGSGPGRESERRLGSRHTSPVPHLTRAAGRAAARARASDLRTGSRVGHDGWALKASLSSQMCVPPLDGSPYSPVLFADLGPEGGETGERPARVGSDTSDDHLAWSRRIPDVDRDGLVMRSCPGIELVLERNVQ